MSKVDFRFGTMNSSKSANLMMIAHNYVSEGRKILVLKSSLDTRWNDGNVDNKGTITSRALKDAVLECVLVSPEEDIFDIIKDADIKAIKDFSVGLSAVLIDEAQFLTKEQVKQLANASDEFDLTVLCFGLKNTYRDGELFKGSEALLYYADNIEEIKTVCKYCDSKATHNLLVVNGEPIYDGSEVVIGDVKDNDQFYAQVCYHHYMNPPIPSCMNNSKGSKNTYDKLFNYILNYNNKDNLFRKKKLGSMSDVVHIDYEDIKNVKFIYIGNIMFDIKKYALDNSRINKVCATTFFNALVDFVYTLFESDRNEAYKLIKSAKCSNIEFYDTEEEYRNSYNSKNGGSLSRFRVLPDGKHYYCDLHAKDYPLFFEQLLAGIKEKTGKEIGYFI